MLEEFVASLTVSRTMSCPSLKHLSAPLAAACPDHEAPSKAIYVCTSAPPAQLSHSMGNGFSTVVAQAGLGEV
jgi:hypothetical protein